MGNLDDDPPIYIIDRSRHPRRRSSSKTAARLHIERIRARLAIVDPLVSFLPVPDTNDYGKVYASLVPLRDLARETECAIVCCPSPQEERTTDAHRVSASWAATAFAAAVDTSIELNWAGTRRASH